MFRLMRTINAPSFEPGRTSTVCVIDVPRSDLRDMFTVHVKFKLTDRVRGLYTIVTDLSFPSDFGLGIDFFYKVCRP